MTLRVFLAGEGTDDIGGWFAEKPHRDPTRRGVVQALLGRVRSDGWEVVEALRWPKIVAYRAGGHRSAEHRKVLALTLAAKEANCAVVVFSRDSDGDTDRVIDIERAMDEAPAMFADCPKIIGGTAVRAVEAWVLAVIGVSATETMSKSRLDKEFEARKMPIHDEPGHGPAMVDLIDREDLSKVPVDAASLRKWATRARRALE